MIDTDELFLNMLTDDEQAVFNLVCMQMMENMVTDEQINEVVDSLESSAVNLNEFTAMYQFKTALKLLAEMLDDPKKAEALRGKYFCLLGIEA